MNIVVCIKQIPDTEGYVNVDQKSVSVYSPNLVMSPLDVLANEEASRIKERLGDVQITIMCMGQSSAEKALRSALSMGADKAVHICDESLNNSDSYVTGLVLAKAIGLEKCDLVLCGQLAADTEEGQVGTVIAEVLQTPLITSVVKIDVDKASDKLFLHRRTGGVSREVVETIMPAVLTVGAGINKPRYPTLRAVKDAEKKQINTLDLNVLDMSRDEVGMAGSLVRVTSISVAKPSLQNLFIPDSSLPAFDRINLLMSGGISEKDVEIIVGEPKEIAMKFIQFASELKII